ncbi:MAG: LPS assembly protein LptD [Silvanigrellaceae bacterium]
MLLAVSLTSRQGQSQGLSDSQSTIYYDADEINLDKETGNLKAKGNAFILLGNVFVSADNVEYNKKLRTMTAEGGVRVVRSRERISASRVLINEETNEARMDDVEIFADPLDTEAKVNEEVLGISSAEMAFEVARQERAKEILKELGEIRSQFANIHDSRNGESKRKASRLHSRYAQLLERLVRTRYQPSDVLRNLPEDARRRIENRREAVRSFASKDPELARKIAGLQRVPGYLNLQAHRVFQNSNQNMDVENASLTTCRCSPGDKPAWGLSASRALVEPNEYITLYGTTLEVAKFPLMYSPWFKMPIKTKRQSGFLLPSFYLSRGGDAASFPYYLTLGENADSTMTFTYFSKRGPRLESELRTALSEESRTTLRGEVLRQKGPVAGITDKEVINRWAWGAQTNAPISSRTSLKIDYEKMSDQRYFSDLTKEPGTTQDLFTPQVIVKRFLQQDATIEHSGESFFVGVSANKPEDVFADSNRNVPSRAPRIDFSIFPRNIAETKIAWEGLGSFEKISDRSPGATEQLPGPLDGSRSMVKVRSNYPMPFNPYANIRIGGEAVHINYQTQRSKGEVNFAQAEVNVDTPLYANLFSLQTDNQLEWRARHNLKPFVSLKWIPDVKRTGKFPDIYSTFYATDNVARRQLLEFGFSTDIQLFKDEFKQYERTDVQSSNTGKPPSPPANEAVLFSLMKLPVPNNPNEAGQVIYTMATQRKPEGLFDQWATNELNQYVREVNVTSGKQGVSFVAAQPVSWRRDTIVNSTPVALSMSSSYNFEAVRTADEQNRNLQPGQTPVSADPWGDVSGSLSLSVQPLLPLAGTVSRVWQPAWRIFKSQSSSLDISSPIGLNASFVQSTNRSEAVDGNGVKTYPEEQLWGIDSSYQPKSWLKFQFQYRKNIKPQPASSSEFEYSSLQKITFLGIQDCVDITLQRFKDREIQERMATWTLGLNLNFLGQQRQIESLGKVVDRAIKSQLNKGQNLSPQ